MKKFFLCTFFLLICVVLCSCGAQTDETPVAENIPSVGLANPWTDYESLAEAIAAVGFDMTVPESIADCDAPIYRAMEGMLEVLYLNDDSEIRIRKAPASEETRDISGDYNEYAEENAVSTAGEDGTAALYGNDGTVSKAIWESGDYCYSITAEPGIDVAVMSQLIMQVT